MRYSLIMLGVCLAAILVGGALYMYGPETLRENPPAEEYASTVDLAEEVSFGVLAEGQNSEIMERKNFAAYTEEDFQELWTRAFGEDATTFPSVDFTNSYVIAVFTGQESSNGYGISVSKIVDEETARNVFVTLTRPGAGCVTSQALTSPYQFIVVPFSDLPLVKVDQELGVCQ